MNQPRFSSDFGPIKPLSPAEIATARANVTAHAHDADDAALLCAALGLEGA